MQAITAVTDGIVVTLHYTLTDDDGEVIDSSRDVEPLAYLHGASNIVPGLEKHLAGRKVGDKLKVTVPPGEGYGERHDFELQRVPLTEFGDDVEFEVGMPIIAEGPDGEITPVWVAEIDDEAIHVDANHPLAGVNLHFDVDIVALRAATDEEKEHGHPHELGGCEHG